MLPHAEPGAIVAFWATSFAVEAHEPADVRGCFDGGLLNPAFVRDVAPAPASVLASWRISERTGSRLMKADGVWIYEKVRK